MDFFNLNFTDFDRTRQELSISVRSTNI